MLERQVELLEVEISNRRRAGLCVDVSFCQHLSRVESCDDRFRIGEEAKPNGQDVQATVSSWSLFHDEY